MFNKNVNSIFNEQNAGFKQKMLETPFNIAQSVISAHKSQSGDYVIALNNVPLDSMENPFEDSKQIVAASVEPNLSQSDVVVIFGFGFGYLPKRVFVETKAKIIIYEPNLNVCRFVFEYVDFSDLLSSHRVIISDDINFCLEKIHGLFFQNEKINFIFNKSYLYLYSEQIKQFSQKIVDTVSMKKSDVCTIKLYGKKWVRNFLVNLPLLENTCPINYLENKFKDKDALVLCAGPSLKENIELIKQHRTRFVVFALNKIADYVISRGVIPDFVIASDSCVFKYDDNFQSPEYKKVNFILSAKCAKSSFKIDANHFFIYYPANSSFVANILQKTDSSLLFDKTSGTTSIYAYECAKMFGCKNIVFAGLDLAFKGDERYGAAVENNKNIVDNKIGFTTVKNVLGQDVQTRKDYAMFIKQFEEAIKDNTYINIYNITSFGAKIEGMRYLSLQQYLDNNEQNTNEDASSIINKVFEDNKIKWHSVYSKMCDCVNQSVDVAKNIKYEETLKDRDISLLPLQYYDFSRNFLMFLQKLLNNDLLSDYFQYEIMSFLAKFEALVIETDEQANEIVNSENAFVADVLEYKEKLSNMYM